MNSAEIKNKVLHYLRFKRKYSLIATEAGRKKKNNADILASNFEEIVEVEVKTSRADLRNDFQKMKHTRYASTRTHFTPNKFYFAVPKKLVEYAIELTKDMGYGVLEVSEKPLTGFTKHSFVTVKKKAKTLKERYCKKLEHEMLMRLSSEMIRLRIKYL
ncbi:hypothetical protein N9948_01870 [bacterium]|nr:hypothetical protein [bacterium]